MEVFRSDLELSAKRRTSFAEENYRDDAPPSARQSIWAYADPMTPPLDYVDFAGARTIIEVGCGNGVWLDLARRRPEVGVTLLVPRRSATVQDRPAPHLRSVADGAAATHAPSVAMSAG